MVEDSEADVAILREMFDAAVDAVLPSVCLPRHLPVPPSGRTIVVGAGKAAAEMAAVVEAHWCGPIGGMVVTRHGHGADCRAVEVVEAAHPVPDALGQQAARRIVGLVGDLAEDDLVLCLLSGGGSALLAMPPEWLPFEDKQRLTRGLLRSGASITEINCVRKHLSSIKGGQLAVACHPAKVVTLAISDVPGDDPSTIASGPTVADPTTAAEALAVLAKYSIALPAAVADAIASHETPKPGDVRLGRCETVVIASASLALGAAARVARHHGLRVVGLGGAVEGEAQDVAIQQADLVREEANGSRPFVVLSGGETTVTVTQDGRGGRNSEFALALALALDGGPSMHAMACDTDGIDGTEDNAGCVVRPGTLRSATKLGMDPSDYLVRHDAYSFFAALNDLVVTGPTKTNVNDFRAILVR